MSLRWRLMLSVGVVVLTSLAAVGYISSRVVRVELNQLSRGSGALPPEARLAAAEAVAARYSTHRLDGMQSFLAQLRDERFPRSGLLLLDPQRRLLAASGPLGANVEIGEQPDGAMRIRFGRGSASAELLVRGAVTDVVVEGEGVIGSLLLTPRWDRRPRDPMRSVNRWLLLAVAVVGAAALGFTALVARSVIAPIERLQQATSRIGGTRPAEPLAERVPVTSRDEVGRLAEAFNAMTVRLQKHEELRRNMVNDVAHELRTPLTNLRAGIEAIQDGLRKPDPKVIDALHDDVLLLQRLVEDLQTLALAEAGRLPLHLERIDLDEELRRFVGSLADDRVQLQAAAAVRIMADPVRLQQILSNLVRNALGHLSPDGTVEITSARGDDSTVILTVTDNGRGIPAADLPHIFERFYRTDASRTRMTGGAGLGLAIVRQLVEVHGGEISVESEEGRTTRFRIEWPIPA